MSGLEGIVAAETVLSDVQGDKGELIIAGHRLENWVERFSYAEAAAVLWQPFLPNVSSTELEQELGQARLAAYQALQPVLELLAGEDSLAALRRGLELALCQADPEQPAQILAALGVSLALHLNPQAAAPDPGAEHVADLLRMLTGQASPAQTKALQAYLLTVSDHGLNASTFTARVIASTASDLLSCVCGALGALKGPLHGGAPGPVLDMLDAIGAPANTSAWVQAQLAQKARIMGFGHRIYRVRDPRADVLKAALRALQGQHPSARLNQAEQIEAQVLAELAAYKPDRKLETNVEFYTALLLEALGFERRAFTAVFALGRALGWCAHVLEQRATGRLIRPASLYTGPQP